MILDDFYQIKNASINWAELADKIVLVTGANGFLPAYMVETLLLLNHDILKKYPCKIIALVRNEEHAKCRFLNYLNDMNFSIIVQDVVDKINIADKIDYIIHAASPASPKYYSIDPVGVIMPNIFGTKNTLDLAREKQVKKYLYFSSGEVYGRLDDKEAIKEDCYGYLDPATIRACYGESKRMGENLCVSYGHQYGIPIKIARPFHTYGPGMKLNDGRVFADFVKNIVHNENIEIKSDGSAKRPFCYLSDATIAFFKIILDDGEDNVYNVANPNATVSIKELATMLVNMFPEKKLKAIFVEKDKNYLQSPVRESVVDISRLEKLGWKPSVSIEDGFMKTIRSYL
ncbi:NAD-dependent epimerase/dehydratase family protein [Campylobacter californiensis]|uniref:NAD-dependent epimerase/dehydratase family protein n=1 Tax=Campylobacter californiensis TaxID=1032243 RepID=UPI001475BBFC|nr:NAD-dependent epimerase/dehydratase family protein [Campylobacter sp. RM12916]MBE3609024.1 NAD-dependent epimerase/dehydratase family protein [Campylobacter sp. RM12916]